MIEKLFLIFFGNYLCAKSVNIYGCPLVCGWENVLDRTIKQEIDPFSRADISYLQSILSNNETINAMLFI